MINPSSTTSGDFTGQSELTEGKAPELISLLDLDIRPQKIHDPSGTIEIYDPWQDKWLGVKAEDR